MQRANSANLDMLRSIAVLLVLGVHYFADVQWMHHRFGPAWEIAMAVGRAGVLLFFVHTALVLLNSMDRRYRETGSLFREFYIRRAFRIYPLSAFMILVVVWARIPNPLEGVYRFIGYRSLVNHLVLVTLSPQQPLVLQPLWSLPYEVQMYLVLPLIYLVIRRHADAGKLLWGGAVLAVTGLCLAPMPGLRDLALFVPCFLGGAIAFQQPNTRRLPAWLWGPAILALVAVFSLFPLDSAVSLIFSWLLCGALGMIVFSFREIQARPVVWVSKRIARYSYGIYLAHVPILWLAFVVCRRWPVAVQFGLCLMLLVVVPVALFHYLEDPLIRLGGRLAASVASPEKCVTSFPAARFS